MLTSMKVVGLLRMPTTLGREVCQQPFTIVSLTTIDRKSKVANTSIVAVQLGNIAATFIYRADDKPLYHRGNTQLIIINVFVIVLFVIAKAYYVFRNKQRDRKWNALSAKVSCACYVETALGHR